MEQPPAAFDFGEQQLTLALMIMIGLIYNGYMFVPILATKRYIPSPRSKLISRPRLVERLNEGHSLGRKLTLISAPAGFGKTTLISEWVAGCKTQREPQVAWLSLDEGDNDPTRFLAYLVAALQMISKDVGKGVLEAIQPSQPLTTIHEFLLATLLNEIAAIPVHFILVLDDYHLIDSEPIDDALTFLLDHLPPQMHLVITTREDPHLPLARYRARGQLTELRAADLRFTPSEAAEFFNQVMGLSLSMEDVAALETRTEGWIAGLQLAALAMQGVSMQSRQDTASFIQSFTGSHRYVLDYLVEEVLQRQPEPVRSFLLQTSILDRLCGPLCDAVCSYGTASSTGTAVTDHVNGKAMLDLLERGNLFVIPLDDFASSAGARHWYRYHHLFAEVLRAFLDEAYTDQVPILHRRASEWFEQNDLPADAIRHALIAKDFERAAGLIEKVWLEMDLSYQSAAWFTWAKALPEEVLLARPVLCVGCAWALLAVGEIEASEIRLRDAERWLDPAGNPSAHSSASPIVVDKAEFQVLPASIAAARAYRALAMEDIPGTKMYASQALALVPEEETVHRTQATALLGMAEYAEGNLPAAEQQFLKFQAMMWQANDTANAISITYILSDIMLVQGRLREVVSAYQQSLQLAAKRGVFTFLGASDLYRGLSEVLCEQDDLEGAAQQLQTAQQMGERNVLTGWPHRLCVAQARMKEAQGDAAGALALLDAAERQHVRNPLPDRPIAALKARVRARHGMLTEALTWVREQNLSPDDDLSYLREFEHLTLARVLLSRYQTSRAEGDLQSALELLERLLKAADAGGRYGSLIEILILQAMAHQAQGDPARAFASLERALALAEPEGYVHIFVDEGEAMRSLLQLFLAEPAHQRDLPFRGYVGKLLAAFPHRDSAPGSATIQHQLDNTQPASLTEPEVRPANNKLVEPAPLLEALSERELEVLRLLRSELSGPEIAQQLVVSLNTLRTHTKNIFSKLGVNNRRAAVHRAAELDLF